MICRITFTKDAVKDMVRIKRSGNKQLFHKLPVLLEELSIHPRSGTGQPERLRHYEQTETWSRRLSKGYRLVYNIYEERIEVEAISDFGHDEDKQLTCQIISEQTYRSSRVMGISTGVIFTFLRSQRFARS